MTNLVGKVAVVTGAASGIGRATSVALAKTGCTVALADLNEQGLQATASAITSAGGRASSHGVDVSKAASVQRLADEILAAHGHVHVLVNNAGVAVVDLVQTGSLEDFEWIMGVNFWGVVHGCRSFLPHLLKEPEAHIVNVSSVYGLVGVPSQSYYCATKFALRGFTDALRIELKGSPVRVSCVYPGGVKTEIAQASRFGTSWNGDDRNQTVAKFSLQARSTPEQAAATIVRGIQKDQRRILVGRDAKFVDWVTRLFPSRGADLIAAILRRSRK